MRNTMTKFLRTVLTAVFMLGTLRAAAQTQDVRLYTEDTPPLNFLRDGEVTGLSTELLREAMKRAQVDYPIRVLPWARAYAAVQEEDHIGLYSTTRTEAREHLFHWVGPLAEDRWVLMKKRGNPLKITALEDAKNVRRIGVIIDDVRETMLKEQGFTNLDSVSATEQNARKLLAGRLDLWFVGEDEAIQVTRGAGLPTSELEVAYVTESSLLYLVFRSTEANLPVVQKLQEAIDSMRMDGVYDEITKRWRE